MLFINPKKADKKTNFSDHNKNLGEQKNWFLKP
jgi:hypothetical protein